MTREEQIELMAQCVYDAQYCFGRVDRRVPVEALASVAAGLFQYRVNQTGEPKNADGDAMVYYQKQEDGSCWFIASRASYMAHSGEKLASDGDIILGRIAPEGYGDIADAITIIDYINDRLSPPTTGSGDETDIPCNSTSEAPDMEED